MGERFGLLTRIAATEKRFVVRADEKLTAFLDLEAASRASSQSLITVATGEVAG